MASNDNKYLTVEFDANIRASSDSGSGLSRRSSVASANFPVDDSSSVSDSRDRAGSVTSNVVVSTDPQRAGNLPQPESNQQPANYQLLGTDLQLENTLPPGHFVLPANTAQLANITQPGNSQQLHYEAFNEAAVSSDDDDQLTIHIEKSSSSPMNSRNELGTRSCETSSMFSFASSATIVPNIEQGVPDIGPRNPQSTSQIRSIRGSVDDQNSGNCRNPGIGRIREDPQENEIGSFFRQELRHTKKRRRRPRIDLHHHRSHSDSSVEPLIMGNGNINDLDPYMASCEYEESDQEPYPDPDPPTPDSNNSIDISLFGRLVSLYMFVAMVVITISTYKLFFAAICKNIESGDIDQVCYVRLQFALCLIICCPMLLSAFFEYKAKRRLKDILMYQEMQQQPRQETEDA